MLVLQRVLIACPFAAFNFQSPAPAQPCLRIQPFIHPMLTIPMHALLLRILSSSPSSSPVHPSHLSLVSSHEQWGGRKKVAVSDTRSWRKQREGRSWRSAWNRKQTLPMRRHELIFHWGRWTMHQHTTCVSTHHPCCIALPLRLSLFFLYPLLSLPFLLIFLSFWHLLHPLLFIILHLFIATQCTFCLHGSSSGSIVGLQSSSAAFDVHPLVLIPTASSHCYSLSYCSSSSCLHNWSWRKVCCRQLESTLFHSCVGIRSGHFLCMMLYFVSRQVHVMQMEIASVSCDNVVDCSSCIAMWSDCSHCATYYEPWCLSRCDERSPTAFASRRRMVAREV